MSIRLSADSTMDLTDNYKEKYQITVIPMHIVYGEESFDDRVTIDPAGIIRRFEETGETPSTSACSIGEYHELFEKLTADGSEVIHFSMSSAMSSTYRNACIAAEEFENVFVLDSRNITGGIGLLALKAAEMREKGFSAKEIVRVCGETVGKIRVSFVLEKLNFLAKGGRCPGVVAFGANILGIKPTIVVGDDGNMTVGKKFRGKFDVCIQKYVEDVLANAENPDLSHAVLVYSEGITEAQIEIARKEMKKHCRFEDILIMPTGSTIVAHCGSNTIGVLYIEK